MSSISTDLIRGHTVTIILKILRQGTAERIGKLPGSFLEKPIKGEIGHG